MTVVVPPGFWEFIMWISTREDEEDESPSSRAREVIRRRAGRSLVRMDDLAPKKRKVNSYNRRYGKAFKRCKSKHMKKNGTWKKGGFKRCVKEAHRLVKK